MLRIFQKIVISEYYPELVKFPHASLQSIRWRKPSWLPIAKSKKFRIAPRPEIPDDERQELKRLNNNYNTYTNSIGNYLIERFSVENQVSLDPAEIMKTFREDFEKCSTVNDEWNVKQKLIREKRISAQLENALSTALEEVQFAEQREKEKLELIEQIVREQKDASVNFITQENVGAAIDKALATEVDFNYAITIDGEKIIGRNTKLEKEEISAKQ